MVIKKNIITKFDFFLSRQVSSNKESFITFLRFLTNSFIDISKEKNQKFQLSVNS